MNRTLYNAAMEKVTMSEQCESRILDAAVNMTPTVRKKRGKIRFIPVLAAVLIIGTTTAAAEGAFSWIKNMFADDSFEITDEIVGMTGEMNNFICESQGGDIEISPVGMIAEDSTIYCLLHVDKMPDDIDFKNLKLQDVYINDLSPIRNRVLEDGGNENVSESTFGYGMKYKDDNLLAIEVFPNYKAFSDDDKITLRFAKLPDSAEYDEMYRMDDTIYWYDGPFECYADVSFDIGMGEVNCFEMTYDNAIKFEAETESGNNGFLIEELYISPLRAIIKARSMHSDNFPRGEIQITFKDGSVETSLSSGAHSLYVNGGYRSEEEWNFENPINPKNISSVYLDGVCLYDSSEE